MIFLNPSFLWALLLVAVPIFIHLFSFRRYTTIYFSQVKFLQQLKKETKSKSRLRNLLVLLLRCLAIVFLVFVFAKPIIKSPEQNISQDEKYLVVYIDNSFSMESLGAEGALLETAKIRAVEMVQGFDYDAKFILLTNEFYPEHQQWVDKNQMINWISSTQSTHVYRDLSEVSDRAHVLLHEKGNTENDYCIILSDFQQVSANFNEINEDSLIRHYALHLSGMENQNLWVDSLWFKTPEHYVGKQEELFVIIKNRSSDDLHNIPVKLFINDTLKSSKNVSINALGDIELSLNYVQNYAGNVNARVELNDYPVSFDNQLFYNYYLADKTKVLIINNEGQFPFLEKLYELEPSFNVTSVNVNAVPYNEMFSYDLVIVNGLSKFSSGLSTQLQQWLIKGGNLVILPGSEISLSSYNSLLQNVKGSELNAWRNEKGRVVNLNATHPIFYKSFNIKGELLDLPTYVGYFPISKHSRSNHVSLFESESGRTLFVQEKIGAGLLYLSCLPLDYKKNSLMQHPIFAPLFYNIVLLSGNYSPLYHTLGSRMLVELNVSKDDFVVPKMYQTGSVDYFRPEYRSSVEGVQLYLSPSLLKAGLYHVEFQKDWVQNLSFNYNRKESDLKSYSIKALKASLEQAGLNQWKVFDGHKEQVASKIKHLNEGVSLQRFFVYLVLIMLFLEALVLRFKK